MLLALKLLNMRSNCLGWIYTDIIPYIVKIVLSSWLKNSIKIIINTYNIESRTLFDTLWLIAGVHVARCLYRFPYFDKCASKHNWPIRIHLTAWAILWITCCWLAGGDVTDDREPWCLILANATKKFSGWRTVTLTDKSVYLGGNLMKLIIFAEFDFYYLILILLIFCKYFRWRWMQDEERRMCPWM